MQRPLLLPERTLLVLLLPLLRPLQLTVLLRLTLAILRSWEPWPLGASLSRVPGWSSVRHCTIWSPQERGRSSRRLERHFHHGRPQVRQPVAAELVQIQPRVQVHALDDE